MFERLLAFRNDVGFLPRSTTPARAGGRGPAEAIGRVRVPWSIHRQDGLPFDDGVVSGMATAMSRSPAVATLTFTMTRMPFHPVRRRDRPPSTCYRAIRPKTGSQFSQ